MLYLAQTYNDFVVAIVGYLAIFAVLTLIFIACKIIGKVISGAVEGSKSEEINGASLTIIPERRTETTAKPFAEFSDRREVIAAISAAIAEDLSEDISKIRITSIKKLS